ncbi:MAG: hemerythrin domain-containing protein [Chloroflexi bacterium]|nr:hemerythrin domain-containing protein [Chloroflexota bacterium]
MSGFCPGSKGMKSPTPEDVKCPECGYEVEIWSSEVMRHCPQCHTPVMRPQKVSCIDWCSFAKECVGPQLYAKLKPAQGGSQSAGPIQSLAHEHDEGIKRLGILKGATLCLRAGSRSSDAASTQTLGQAVRNVGEVLNFFDAELRKHFQREEDGLFPLMEKHLSRDGSPIAQMLVEHQELWQRIARLQEAASLLPPGGKGVTPKVADEVERAASEVIRLLREHIEKENTILLPLATDSVPREELADLGRSWSPKADAAVGV